MMERGSMRLFTAEELKQEYIQCALEISKIQSSGRNYLYKITELFNRQRDLTNTAESLDRCDDQIQMLEKQREDIGWLKLNDRLNHEEEIMRAKNKRRLEIESLKENHDITPEEIPARWQEIDKELSTLKAKQEKLPDIRGLQHRQKEIGAQYQAALQRENRQDKKLEAPATHTDKMAVARAENELEKLAESAAEKKQAAENKQTPQKEQKRQFELSL